VHIKPDGQRSQGKYGHQGKKLKEKAKSEAPTLRPVVCPVTGKTLQGLLRSSQNIDQSYFNVAEAAVDSSSSIFRK
jgi:hypothetical protein